MKYNAQTFYLHMNKEAVIHNCGIIMSVQNTNDSYGPRCFILAGASYLQLRNEYNFVQASLPTQQKLQELFVKNRDNPDFYFDKINYRDQGRIPNLVRASDNSITQIHNRPQLLYILNNRPLNMTTEQKTHLLNFYDALNDSFNTFGNTISPKLSL